jgi:hypothetical protein
MAIPARAFNALSHGGIDSLAFDGGDRRVGKLLRPQNGEIRPAVPRSWCITTLPVSRGFKNNRNVALIVWLTCITTSETIMSRIAALPGVLAIGLASGAYAQTTGPAAQQDMSKPSMTNTNSHAMKKSGTTVCHQAAGLK